MQISNIAVIGLQWGDEGKGKVVDAVAQLSRYVVRYCGGANAGHSVQIGDQKYALHLIPCGIFQEGVLNIIGNGVAFDPEVALGELAALAERGLRLGPDRLVISSAAHIVMPWHKLQDSLSEAALGADKIGTTIRGIGPCYADKATRTVAIRAGDLTDAGVLGEKIARIAAIKSTIFAALYDAEPIDADAITDEYVEFGRQLAPMIANVGPILRSAGGKGERIMFEGGQGSLLDIDHGTYPFVTSSMVSACGIPGGAGVPPSAVGTVIGVMKAYSSRVGAGPFPSEQDNETGQFLRDRGHEYGTTTGRPRRCGWLDAFAVRYAVELSGVAELAVTLLDVLSGLDELKICTGYQVNGQAMTDYDPAALADAQPIYETLPGWSQDISQCNNYDDLPAAAKAYVARVEELVGIPTSIVSVGPARHQTIFRQSQIEELS